MLKAKVLLSGVKRISNVVADIPLLSIHVARAFDPIDLSAATDWKRERTMERRKKTESEEDRGTSIVRLGREKRIAPGLVIFAEKQTCDFRGRVERRRSIDETTAGGIGRVEARMVSDAERETEPQGVVWCVCVLDRPREGWEMTREE
jgi:hypothetical protein